MFCFLPALVFAETHVLEGRVTNNKMEPLGYVTVQLKEQKLGTRTDEQGHYIFKLEEGDYDLVFSLVGYKTQTIKVIVQKNGKTTKNVILEESNRDLGEVRIAASKRDKAEDYIREVIQHKEQNQTEVNSYACKVYIKATEETETTLNERKKKRSKKPENSANLSDSLKVIFIQDSIRKAKEQELKQMSMAEIVMDLNYAYPDKIKETRTGVKRRGNTEALFYQSTTEGNFSLYQNLIKVDALSILPFLSPISYSGLVAYKFKTIKADKKSKCTIYTIRFTPIKAGNALIEGEVDIVDTSWAIINTMYRFPEHLMPEYNYFQVELSYEIIQNKTWMLDRMELNYFSKEGKAKKNGSTTIIFDDYKLDTTFKKKHFNSEVSSTSLEAYERDSNFWNTVRKVPLTEKEMQFIHFKDSVYEYTHTQHYLDSIDKRKNKITLQDVFLDGIEFYKRKYDRTIYLFPITSIFQPLYPGGYRLAYGGSYAKTPKSKKNFGAFANLAYSPKMKDVVGFMSASVRYNPFSNGYLAGSFGRNYDFIFNNDSYINFFRRSNFFKKDYMAVEHGLELLNGLILRNRFELALRSPIQINNRDSAVDKWLGSVGSDSATYVTFKPYNAFYGIVTLEYTPKQMYMREPRQKVILGSKYPTVYATWRKGVRGIFNSSIDFDYLEFGLRQKLKLGLLGTSEYQVFSGNFLSKRNLQTIDYKFIRRGDPLFFFAPQQNFQALDSSFALFRNFYEGHFLHQFYGSLINKIPYMKYLKLYEIAGGGALYAPERKLIYTEFFAGIEKPFRMFNTKFKFGTYVVTSIANKNNNPFQFKIGLQSYNMEKNRWE